MSARTHRRVVLALDQGTTSSRALVVGADGRVLASAQRAVRPRYPQPGWVELDALEIWETQRRAAVDALSSSGRTVADVAAVGIADQRETTIVWDRTTSEPIAPAIVWQDRRTAGVCEALRRAGHEEAVRRSTGLVLDPYFSATKIAWLLDHVSGARARAEAGELAFGTVDSWLVWRLTGGRSHVTDATNASRTLLYDLRSGGWDAGLLDLFGVPAALLPRICDSSGVVGAASAELFGAPLPVAGIAGDQQAALFGQACTEPGMAKVTYGTGCFLLVHAGAEPRPSRHGLLTTVALQRCGERSYALEGSVFVGGAAVEWLRDGLGLVPEVADSARLAAEVPSSEGVYFVPALTGLGAPHWDPYARGAILGLTRGTRPAHIARAALEGIAFQVAELLAAVEDDTGVSPAELRADGAAAANDLLLQLQADVLGVPVTRAAHTESTALGAAWLAGLAVGLWKDEAQVRGMWRAGRSFEPSAGVDREALLEGWRAAVACVREFARRVT